MNHFGCSRIDIQGQLIHLRAEVTMTQIFFNHSQKNLEFNYVFPVPPKAQVSNFIVKIGDRQIISEIVESEEAYRHYDQAIHQGHSAAIIESLRGDTLELSLGNIPPNETVSIQIKYFEQLNPVDEGQSLQWRIPTVLAPRYFADPSPEKLRAQPYIGDHDTRLSLGLHLSMLSPIGMLSSPSHLIAVALDGHQATIQLAKANEKPDSDFVLDITLEEAYTSQNFTTLRTPQGLFSLIQLSPELKEPPKQDRSRSYTFILDRSGSMDGEKLKQAQLAVKLCLRQLSEQDSFNLIAFDSEFSSFSPRALSFTDQTLKMADSWIDTIYARGGTEIFAPLEFALKTLAPEKENIIFLFTDGQVSEEDATMRLLETYNTRLQLYPFGIDTAVNSSFIDGLALAGGGLAEYIYPGESLEDKILRQFTRIHSPYLEKARILDDSGHEVEVFPEVSRRLFSGEQYYFLYKHDDDKALQNPILHGFQQSEELVIPLVFSPAGSNESMNHISSWWAMEKIRHLEHQLDNCIPRRRKMLEKEILDLSIQHQVLSTLSCLVALMPRAEKLKGMPDFVKVPVSLPRHWNMPYDVSLSLKYCCLDSSYDFDQAPQLSKSFGKSMLSMPNPLHDDPLEDLIQSSALMQNADGSVGQDSDCSATTALFILGMAVSERSLRKYRKALQKAIQWLVEHGSSHPLLVACSLFLAQSRLNIVSQPESTRIEECLSLMNEKEKTIYEDFIAGKAQRLWQSLFPEISTKLSNADLAKRMLEELSHEQNHGTN